MTDAIRDAMQRRSFGDVFWWRFWPKSHFPRMAFYGAARVVFFAIPANGRSHPEIPAKGRSACRRTGGTDITLTHTNPRATSVGFSFSRLTARAVMSVPPMRPPALLPLAGISGRLLPLAGIAKKTTRAVTARSHRMPFGENEISAKNATKKRPRNRAAV